MFVFVERYIARSLALIIYFSGFPILTSAVFAFAALDVVYALIMVITAACMFTSAAIVLETFFGRGAIRILAIGSTVPLVLFLLFNLSFTAFYAHTVYSTLQAEAEQFFFRDIAAQVFSGYERIIPRLWVTAFLYGAATLGFWLALRGQRQVRADRSHTDRDPRSAGEPTRDRSSIRRRSDRASVRRARAVR